MKSMKKMYSTQNTTATMMAIGKMSTTSSLFVQKYYKHSPQKLSVNRT